jgi:hypothetical protein
MKNVELNRRDLGRLTAAALGGAIAGSLLAPGLQGALHAAEPAKPDDRPWLKEPHICCGLNTCKGHGKGASNDCAGTGTCATVAAHGCAGKGSCAVPVRGEGWKKARANWETAMTRAGKKFGPAPKECGGA